ncbi:uncharacterized protein LOC125031130 [Penaeus chinensis]|uniref:uncharacterized protein LOC125031130 n=1 Tax=Penaeus chinensis TaxID=139456 RepID=UPI001FB77C43|nr:uncharacterized protein LOC125031130 [Penaeus chinensis]
MQHRQTLPEEAEKDAAHEFEIRFSFHHDLPSPLSRGVSAFVYSPWASVVKKKKRHAPPPPPPASRLCEDVQSSAFHMYNAYEVISIQTHKEITIISNAPRLLTTFSSNSSLEAMKEPKEFPQAGKNKTIPQHVSASTTNVHDSKGRSPRGASKKDNLKQRKNNSHVSIVKRNMEAGKKGASRARKEAKEERGKITKEPTYEEIEDYLDDEEIEDYRQQERHRTGGAAREEARPSPAEADGQRELRFLDQK